jgi:acetyl-CoA carboxylase, biotin carboxylase subunit
MKSRSGVGGAVGGGVSGEVGRAVGGEVGGPLMLRRVVVANRGEIAARVIRTCRRLGIETVLTVSDADSDSLPARLADQVIRIGEAPAAGSYLNVDAVVRAAVAVGADAIHPGYGFLSENARLARACVAAGIVFVGPDARTLAAAGDKLAAREHAIAAGLPVVPGGDAQHGDRRHIRQFQELPGAAADDTVASELAERIGYPVLIKAAGGGGGRGLRVVHEPSELGQAVSVASAEAEAAFGDSRVYLERYVERGRHVEVQLLGDGERVIHLGDRDCSVQRRYQKLIEEAPAPLLDPDLRARLHAAAVALGVHLRYRGAGTVEFLVDTARGEFYFLEVNARIQVEHPVTEAITGLDIVEEQLAIAEGRPLRLRQGDVTFTGHAIECRINAEDPGHDFRPSPGTITRAVFPATILFPATTPFPTRTPNPRHVAAVRVDTHIQAGSTVPPYYDSLLAKVIAWGGDRAAALSVLASALDRCAIDGVTTNLDLQRAVIASPSFAAGGVDTGYLARWLEGTRPGATTRDGNGGGPETAGSVRDDSGVDGGQGGGRG